MNKIILINPPSPGNKKISRFIDCSQEAKADYLYQPIEFMTITSLLEKEDQAIFIDGTADSLKEKEFLDLVKKAEGDIVFLSMSSVCWTSDYHYFKLLKGMFPNAPFFVIGDICLDKHYRSIVLKQCDGFITNPYILDLKKMIEVKKSGNAVGLPGVCNNEEEDAFGSGKKAVQVNSSIPRHEIFIKPGYKHPFAQHFKHATVMTMFGCPFSCTYCPTSKFAPVVRKAEDVLKELTYLHSLGVKELYFADRTFGFPPENSLAILKGMINNFNFSWSCFLQPKLFSPKLLEMMHQAGCHTVNIGIDSANLESLRKYKRYAEESEINGLITLANRLKMSICADFIIGLEDESEQDILNTVDYALGLPIDFASFNIAAPLPGSGIREKAILAGKVAEENDGFDSSGRGQIMGNEKIDSKTLKKLRREAIRRFYIRPSFLLRRLRKTSSLEHFAIQINQMLKLFI